MISLENVSKGFNDFQAVNDVSFQVEAGERFVLVGSSGSGKTTTLKMINRLITPDSGRIKIRDKDIQDVDPIQLRRSIGYVMQHAGLFPHLTILENVSLLPRLLKWPGKKIIDRAAVLMEVLGLPFERYNALKPEQLSGGQQQRIGIVRALMANPPIILMDEPFGALDPITRLNLRKEFNRLEELRAKTIILVTHDINEATELGQRIGIMEKGSLIQVDTAVNFMFKPATPYVKQFFSEKLYSSLLMQMSLGDLIKNDDYKYKLAEHGILGADIFEVTNETPVGLLLDKLAASKMTQMDFIYTAQSGKHLLTLNEEQIVRGFLQWKDYKYSE